MVFGTIGGEDWIEILEESIEQGSGRDDNVATWEGGNGSEVCNREIDSFGCQVGGWGVTVYMI